MTMLRTLRESDLLRVDAAGKCHLDAGAGLVSSSIEKLVLTRMDLLAPHESLLLKLCACVRAPVGLQELPRLMPPSAGGAQELLTMVNNPSSQRLTPLQARKLMASQLLYCPDATLEEGGGVQCLHALTQDVAYSSMAEQVLCSFRCR